MKHNSSFLFSKKKLPHLIIIISLYLLGLATVLLLRPSYLMNICIVYIPGLIYIFILLKNSKKKILLFTLLCILFIIPVEILARLTDSWDVQSTLPRIYDIAPVENMLYAIINICYPLSFYEYFNDLDRNARINSRYKILLLAIGILFLSVNIVYFFNAKLLNFPYWFLGVLIITPNLILLFLFKKHIIKRLILPAIVFGLMFGLHEIVSMYLGHWWWPGDYLLSFNIYGYTYPLDDIIIWLMFSNIAVIAGYEFFWD